MYKLVAIDLDGTLLNSYGEVSNKNKETIQKAIKNGTKLILENEFLDYCTHGIPEETE